MPLAQMDSQTPALWGCHPFEPVCQGSWDKDAFPASVSGVRLSLWGLPGHLGPGWVCPCPEEHGWAGRQDGSSEVGAGPARSGREPEASASPGLLPASGWSQYRVHGRWGERASQCPLGWGCCQEQGESAQGTPQRGSCWPVGTATAAAGCSGLLVAGRWKEGGPPPLSGYRITRQVGRTPSGGRPQPRWRGPCPQTPCTARFGETEMDPASKELPLRQRENPHSGKATRGESGARCERPVGDSSMPSAAEWGRGHAVVRRVHPAQAAPRTTPGSSVTQGSEDSRRIR